MSSGGLHQGLVGSGRVEAVRAGHAAALVGVARPSVTDASAPLVERVAV